MAAASLLLPLVLLVGWRCCFTGPFDWFAQGYNELSCGRARKTASGSYLVHWGLFLFVITAWLFDESGGLDGAHPAVARSTGCVRTARR